MANLVEFLTSIDDLETWKDPIQGYDECQVARAYKEAQRLWLKRMISSQRLFLHPDIVENIKSQDWEATDLQKRMIWASLIVADESASSKKRMYKIKESIINKHGKDWWEDVYSRIKPAYAAKERIKKIGCGPAMSTFISSTLIGAEAARMDRDGALRMIPKR